MRPYFAIIAILAGIGMGNYSQVHSQGLFSPRENSKISQGIRASLLPDAKSVYLLWEPGDNEGEVIIARSNSIINTPEKLYVADSLGRFPAKSKTSVSNYYDYNLKPGTYYYAVVPVDDVRKRTVKLVPNQNFTTEPMVVEKSTQTSDNKTLIADGEVSKSRSVGAIVVKAESDNIRVNWVPSWNAIPGKTIYSVYKSGSPLDSMEAMKKADKLAELPHPVNTYLDQSIEKSQTLFYGVSVKDENSEETLPLEKGKSFVRIFFIKGKSGKSEAVRDTEPSEVPSQEMNDSGVIEKFQVRGFGYTRQGSGAILSWLPPGDADNTTQYTIYAATVPFNKGVNSFVGGGVLKVGTLSHPKSSLRIKEIKRVDSLYFAITAKKAGIPENFDLVEGLNTFEYQFERDLNPEDSARLADQKSEKKEKPEKVTASSVTDPSQTKKLGKIKEEDSDGDDDSKETAIEQKIDSTKNPDLTIGEIVSSEIGYSDLETIIKNTYIKKDYHKSIVYIRNYIIKNKNSSSLGMAYFYLGLSYYRVKEYKKALNCFLKEETGDYKPERTEFWKNQTLARIGKR